MKKKILCRLNPFYRFYLGLLCILALVRWIFPGVMQRAEAQPLASREDGKPQPVAYIHYADPGLPSQKEASTTPEQHDETNSKESQDDAWQTEEVEPTDIQANVMTGSSSLQLLPLPSPTTFGPRKQRVYSVPGTYLDNFPDIQDVQYPSATHWGIAPMKNRNEFPDRRSQLVYVGSNPYIHLDENMSSSIPYLVPRASDLLEHLGKAFMDSLYSKRIPLHKFVVSSVLRTEADVARLSVSNVNATQRSCHLFGTTFDINYNRYYTVSSPDGPARREVRNDSLKMVLSEVLRDARKEGRCHVRYEILQPCFHITVR